MTKWILAEQFEIKMLQNDFRKATLLLIVLLICLRGNVFSQNAGDIVYLKPGMQLPDYFFKDVQYYKKTKVSLSDFLGKWLVLDFWARGCPGCIAAMPMMDKLQKEMGSNVQVLLVGVNVTFATAAERSVNPNLTGDDYIRKLYGKVRERTGIGLPVAWDTALFRRFLGQGVPYTIVVDPKGVIRGLTSSLTERQMNDFVLGKLPLLTEYNKAKPEPGARQFDYSLPLLTNGIAANGGTDTAFLYRDLLMKSDSEVEVGSGLSFSDGTFGVMNVPLAFMIRVAFSGKTFWNADDTSLYGKMSQFITYETKDSIKLQYGQRYSYNLTLNKIQRPPYSPPTDRELQLFMEIFQRDLTINFPYYITLATRPTKYYRLVTIDSAKTRLLTTHGGKSELHVHATDILATNLPMVKFSGALLAKTRERRTYLSDETGITGNIDIRLDALSADFDDLKQALWNYGLDLVPGIMEMKTIVVRDTEK